MEPRIVIIALVLLLSPAIARAQDAAVPPAAEHFGIAAFSAVGTSALGAPREYPDRRKGRVRRRRWPRAISR